MKEGDFQRLLSLSRLNNWEHNISGGSITLKMNASLYLCSLPSAKKSDFFRVFLLLVNTGDDNLKFNVCRDLIRGILLKQVTMRSRLRKNHQQHWRRWDLAYYPTCSFVNFNLERLDKKELLIGRSSPLQRAVNARLRCQTLLFIRLFLWSEATKRNKTLMSSTITYLNFLLIP